MSATLRARRLGQGRRRGRVGVGDEGQPRCRARRDIAAVDLADPTRPDDPESHTLLLLRAPILPDAARQKKNIRSILTWE